MRQPDTNTDREKYELLCALAAAHELTADEQKEFDAHTTDCEICREGLASLRQTLDRVVGDVLSAAPALDEAAHAVKFAGFAQSNGLKFSDSARRALGVESAPFRIWSSPAVAWTAAGAIGALAAGFVVLAPRAAPITLAIGSPRPPVIVQAQAVPEPPKVVTIEVPARDPEREQKERAELGALEAKLQSAEQAVASLQGELSERDHEIVHLRLSSADGEKQLRATQASMAALNSRNGDLTASLAAARVREADAAAQVRDEKLRAERDSQLTAATREVRELMGARRLYMIDVYDGDDPVRSHRSFGRVFYTQGKSLIFYAFDLDKIKVPKRVTFAAWGERAKDAATIQPLGVFNLDDETQKRWVMKVDDPSKLKAIDAIFVTVESKPSFDRPTGQKLLYAYLGGPPNHP